MSYGRGYIAPVLLLPISLAALASRARNFGTANSKKARCFSVFDRADGITKLTGMAGGSCLGSKMTSLPALIAAAAW